ncbi:hypothetical protein LEP1GSC062_0440 [Leptospira alexanderi serovar Manhao 3 str. L 60]|uniref:Transposase InsH N-terminal domain-containing protein n=1 Tax=Leptospira alexanderi serovar Manhao 3 str. L 60 TaxID=1049759 RepID=V6I3N8_9LEPT|nr:hypothetical protein [Leptospira alexanderi]EQA64581.1 hypothetical protein LEP1GSC062_0440 [Leptospira alexanderi serovar Manhao 3 str. L 60]
MAKFKNTDPNQLRMHVLDFQELCGEGHPIHGFKKVIDRLDFENFEKNYQNDETGRPAISPKKVISALFYSILIGNLSMRELCSLSHPTSHLVQVSITLDRFYVQYIRVCLRSIRLEV